jgi:DNA-binding transcriptional LysR family regulator
VPLLLCEFQRAHPELRVSLSIWDTQAVIERVAEREVELGIVGAARRNRSLVFEPLARDEIVLAVPPGHPAAGNELSTDDLRAETLIAMQAGAGVRQVVDEELRRAGLRLRGLEPRLELGLQESVKSAVAAGYGVAFISRTAIEGELAAGTLAAARVAGLEPSRQLYVVRAKGRAPTRAAERFLEFARARVAA